MSGYDHHVREFVRELVRQGVAVQLIDLPEWGSTRLPSHLLDPWYERLDAPVDAGVTLHFTMPTQVARDGVTRDVNYTMFEATRVHPDWIRHNRTHDLVVVPTESSRQAWVESGMPPGQIRVCPLGIDADLFRNPAEPLRLWTETGVEASEYRVRFLNVSELGPRKNFTGLLRAWLLASRAGDDALLLVKLSRARPDWLAILKQQLRTIEHETGRRFQDAAPVEILFDFLADAEMPRLYAAATHYISMSHGEGWDQPMVEAAASGLWLIAPDHSAYRAYLTPDTATLLPAREVPAQFKGDPALQELFRGANWWEPDLDVAVAAIRAAIDGTAVQPHGARDRVLSHFSWQQSTRTLIDILSEVSARR